MMVPTHRRETEAKPERREGNGDEDEDRMENRMEEKKEPEEGDPAKKNDDEENDAMEVVEGGTLNMSVMGDNLNMSVVVGVRDLALNMSVLMEDIDLALNVSVVLHCRVSALNEEYSVFMDDRNSAMDKESIPVVASRDRTTCANLSSSCTDESCR